MNQLYRCLLRDARDSHSILQYRRPIQAQKTIPSPMLVQFEMRYVYLGPYMNAMNAMKTNAQVKATF